MEVFLSSELACHQTSKMRIVFTVLILYINFGYLSKTGTQELSGNGTKFCLV